MNDYLARRDSEWVGQVPRFLGLSVGLVQQGLGEAERKAAYASDITYVTNSELGFDYLRDNLAQVSPSPPAFLSTLTLPPYVTDLEMGFEYMRNNLAHVSPPLPSCHLPWRAMSLPITPLRSHVSFCGSLSLLLDKRGIRFLAVSSGQAWSKM